MVVYPVLAALVVVIGAAAAYGAGAHMPDGGDNHDAIRP